MNVHALKTDVGTPLVNAPAAVVALSPKRAPAREKYGKMVSEVAVRVIPPLIVFTILMVFWELVCRRAGSTLPPPSKVYADTKELIFDPFFDRGGIDFRDRKSVV